MTQVGSILRTARLKKDLSPRDIELLSGGTITNQYVTMLETKYIHPSPKKLRVLSKVLKLDFVELMIAAGHISRADLDGGK